MSGGSKSPTSTTTVNQNYSPEEAARRAALMAEGERIYGTTKGAVPQGPTPSADTLQAQQMMRGAAAGPVTDIAGMMPQAVQFGMHDVLNPASNPALQATLDTATRQVGNAYTDPGGVLARIRQGFDIQNSGGSSTREGIAGGIAGREYLNTIGDVTGRITSDAYSKGLDTFSRTMALAPQAISTATAPAGITSAVGQQTEAYQEAARQWDLAAPWAALGPYANIVNGLSNPSTTTTATAPGATKSSIGGALGGALTGAAIGSVVPGLGTMAGAGIGLMMGLFM